MAVDLVDAAAVYSCTGNPEPGEIRECTKWLMNDSFVATCESASPRPRARRRLPPRNPGGPELTARPAPRVAQRSAACRCSAGSR